MTFRSYRCESSDPKDSEHVDAVDEATAAMGYRTMMIQEHGRAPNVVRVWCPPQCCNGCVVTLRFEERAELARLDGEK